MIHFTFIHILYILSYVVDQRKRIKNVTSSGWNDRLHNILQMKRVH